MNIWNDIDSFEPVRNPVVTIGTFDGVHLGHQKIISTLNEIARNENGESIIITFTPHPRIVVSDNPDEVKLLNTIDEKIEILDKLGVQNIVSIPFTKEFSKQPPSTFLNDIVIGRIMAKFIIIGFDHRFGHDRKGSYNFLEDHQSKYGYQTIEVPPFEMDDISVSSTKIRKALEQGNIPRANSFLGYEYSVSGFVKKGIGLGRQIGFPTANISNIDKEKQIPADGVYVVKVLVGSELHFGMLNIGNNPTISNKGRSIEVNIFDFDSEIYNAPIKVSFIERLRSEIRFENVDLLVNQIKADKKSALEIIRLYNTNPDGR
jgi:riboflavin kinase/FMN adenylyltransferase